MSGHESESGDILKNGKAGVSDAVTLAAEPGQSVVEPADRVKHPGTHSLAPRCAREVWVSGGRMLSRCDVHEPDPCPDPAMVTPSGSTTEGGGS